MSAPEERAGRVATARGWAPDMRSMRLAVVAAAVLVIAGGGAFYAATRYAAPSQGGGAFRIAVTEGACDPAEITVPAGSHRFEVVNRTDRPVEWEILDGVMVVAERENITPGLTQTLSATLEPGDYAITCGLLSNPRGTLHVTRSTVAAANTPAGPRLRDFIGPLSEYKVFLAMQGAALTTKVGELQAAIAANDLGKARDAYVAARLPFERIAPAASRYGDLMNRIDPQAAYLAKREADPAFTGFHRIEYGLYAKNSADGLQPVADQLAADAAALKGRLRELSLEPTMLAEGAARTAGRLASGEIVAGKDAYAATDLADIAANLEGIAKIAGLLTPVVEAHAPQVAADVNARLADVRRVLVGLKGSGGAANSYEGIPRPRREKLAEAFGALGEALGRLHPAVTIS